MPKFEGEEVLEFLKLPGTSCVSPCSGSSENGSDAQPEKKDDGAKKQKVMFVPKKAPEKVPIGPPKKGIQIKLGSGSSSFNKSGNAPVKSLSVAAAFNVDDDDEPEEMPPEARMRMRNIGRETPTSAGPNSFGKTKQGFCDAKKMFEKTMNKAMDTTTPSQANEESV